MRFVVSHVEVTVVPAGIEWEFTHGPSQGSAYAPGRRGWTLSNRSFLSPRDLRKAQGGHLVEAWSDGDQARFDMMLVSNWFAHLHDDRASWWYRIRAGDTEGRPQVSSGLLRRVGPLLPHGEVGPRIAEALEAFLDMATQDMDIYKGWTPPFQFAQDKTREFLTIFCRASPHLLGPEDVSRHLAAIAVRAVKVTDGA